jgi:hypothetical protein
METGQFEVKVSDLQLNRRGRGRRGVSGGIELYLGSGGSLPLALISVTALIAGIVFMNIHLVQPGWFCLGLAAIGMLGVLLRR